MGCRFMYRLTIYANSNTYNYDHDDMDSSLVKVLRRCGLTKHRKYTVFVNVKIMKKRVNYSH